MGDMESLWDARSFAERMDDETLLYAAKKLSEIRPEVSPNREEGAAERQASGGAESTSPSVGLSGAAPRADTISASEGRNRALEAWRRHTCGSIYALSGQVCQMPRGHGGPHTAYRSSWDDAHAAGNRYRPDDDHKYCPACDNGLGDGAIHEH